MSSIPSGRYPLVEAIEDCPEDIRAMMLAVQEKSGFVPNVFLMLARRPAEFRAFFAYHDALMLRIYRKDALIADHLATNWRKAALSARERAMLDFAMKVACESHTLTDADHDALTEHGFSAEDVWDIGAIAAFFAMSNRIANFSGMMPNPEFHLLGRIPRPPR
jgi:alkylhydroperoxidase family enzyme